MNEITALRRLLEAESNSNNPQEESKPSGIKQTVKAAWEKLKELFSKLIETVSTFITNITSGYAITKKILDKFKKDFGNNKEVFRTDIPGMPYYAIKTESSFKKISAEDLHNILNFDTHFIHVQASMEDNADNKIKKLDEIYNKLKNVKICTEVLSPEKTCADIADFMSKELELTRTDEKYLRKDRDQLKTYFDRMQKRALEKSGDKEKEFIIEFYRKLYRTTLLSINLQIKYIVAWYKYVRNALKKFTNLAYHTSPSLRTTADAKEDKEFKNWLNSFDEVNIFNHRFEDSIFTEMEYLNLQYQRLEDYIAENGLVPREPFSDIDPNGWMAVNESVGDKIQSFLDKVKAFFRYISGVIDSLIQKARLNIARIKFKYTGKINETFKSIDVDVVNPDGSVFDRLEFRHLINIFTNKYVIKDEDSVKPTAEDRIAIKKLSYKISNIRVKTQTSEYKLTNMEDVRRHLYIVVRYLEDYKKDCNDVIADAERDMAYNIALFENYDKDKEFVDIAKRAVYVYYSTYMQHYKESTQALTKMYNELVAIAKKYNQDPDKLAKDEGFLYFDESRVDALLEGIITEKTNELTCTRLPDGSIIIPDPIQIENYLDTVFNEGSFNEALKFKSPMMKKIFLNILKLLASVKTFFNRLLSAISPIINKANYFIQTEIKYGMTDTFNVEIPNSYAEVTRNHYEEYIDDVANLSVTWYLEDPEKIEELYNKIKDCSVETFSDPLKVDSINALKTHVATQISRLKETEKKIRVYQRKIAKMSKWLKEEAEYEETEQLLTAYKAEDIYWRLVMERDSLEVKFASSAIDALLKLAKDLGKDPTEFKESTVDIDDALAEVYGENVTSISEAADENKFIKMIKFVQEKWKQFLAWLDKVRKGLYERIRTTIRNISNAFRRKAIDKSKPKSDSDNDDNPPQNDSDTSSEEDKTYTIKYDDIMLVKADGKEYDPSHDAVPSARESTEYYRKAKELYDGTKIVRKEVEVELTYDELYDELKAIDQDLKDSEKESDRLKQNLSKDYSYEISIGPNKAEQERLRAFYDAYKAQHEMFIRYYSICIKELTKRFNYVAKIAHEAGYQFDIDFFKEETLYFDESVIDKVFNEVSSLLESSYEVLFEADEKARISLLDRIKNLFQRLRQWLSNLVNEFLSNNKNIEKKAARFIREAQPYLDKEIQFNASTINITDGNEEWGDEINKFGSEYQQKLKIPFNAGDIESLKEVVAKIDKFKVTYKNNGNAVGQGDTIGTYKDIVDSIKKRIPALKGDLANIKSTQNMVNMTLSKLPKTIETKDEYELWRTYNIGITHLNRLASQAAYADIREINHILDIGFKGLKKESKATDEAGIDFDMMQMFVDESLNIIAEAQSLPEYSTGYETISEENIVKGFIKNQQDIAYLKKQWTEAADKFVTHRWVQRFITPAQEEMISKYYAQVSKEEVSYGEYKKAFNFLCKFMGLPNKGIMLEHLEFDNDPHDKTARIVKMCYSKGQIKVKIPEGLSLIHVSPVEGIQALNPSFRNKKLGHFMYPSKRVFFTVAKDIKAKNASMSGMKTYRYRAKQNIQYAYIDPACSSWGVRAVYIETDKPVPVERYDHFLDRLFAKMDSKTKNTAKQQEEKAEQIKEAYANFGEVDLFSEGTFQDFMDRLKTWKTHNEGKQIQEFSSSRVSDDDFIRMQQLMRTMRTVESYTEYKKAFDEYCRFCHIAPQGTIIYSSEFKKNNGDDQGNYIKVRYAYNTKQIDIPDDAELYHNTTIEGIKELMPFFRGKSVKGYLYDKPRIYFTLNKNMFKLFADYKPGEKTHQYVATKKIRQAYVDPLVPGAINRAIYVVTNKPIPVVPVEEKLKQQHENTQFIAQVVDFLTEFDMSVVLDDVSFDESVYPGEYVCSDDCISENEKNDINEQITLEYAAVFMSNLCL